MVQEIYIKGMHCDGCISKMTQAIRSVNGIVSVAISRNPDKAIITTNREIPRAEIEQVVQSAGSYSVISAPSSLFAIPKIKTYLPLIIAFSAVCGITAIRPILHGFDLYNVMHDFMGAFFLIFGGLKALSWKGFAENYRSYDPLAKKSRLYAYLYPAIELYLGLSYESRFLAIPSKEIIFPEVVANTITIAILTIATIGIIKVLRRKQNVQCACLGSFFTIPITWFTVFENVLMIAMAIYMQVVFGHI